MIPHIHSTHNVMLPPMNDDLGRISDTVNTDQDPEDDMDPGRVRFDGARKDVLMSKELLWYQSMLHRNGMQSLHTLSNQKSM